MNKNNCMFFSMTLALTISASLFTAQQREPARHFKVAQVAKKPIPATQPKPSLKRSFNGFYSTENIEGGQELPLKKLRLDPSIDYAADINSIAEKAKTSITEHYYKHFNIKRLLINSLYTTIVMSSDYEDNSVVRQILQQKGIYPNSKSIWHKIKDKNDFKRKCECQQGVFFENNNTTGYFIDCFPGLYQSQDRLNLDLCTVPAIDLAQQELYYFAKFNILNTHKEYLEILIYLTRFFYNYYPLINVTDEELRIMNINKTDINKMNEDEINQIFNKLLPFCQESANGMFNIIASYHSANASSKILQRKSLLLLAAKEKLNTKLYNELATEIDRLSEIY